MQNFLLDIVMPDNIWQMVVWYLLLVVCTILYLVERHKKRSKKRNELLQEKINAIEEIKEQMMRDKSPNKKDLYSATFTLASIAEYCKQTFEVSQFVVYDEAGKNLDKAVDLVKKLYVKKWKDDKTNHYKTLIVELLDNAVQYLSQAL